MLFGDNRPFQFAQQLHGFRVHVAVGIERDQTGIGPGRSFGIALALLVNTGHGKERVIGKDMVREPFDQIPVIGDGHGPVNGIINKPCFFFVEKAEHEQAGWCEAVVGVAVVDLLKSAEQLREPAG